jgi:hypothetical protein
VAHRLEDLDSKLGTCQNNEYVSHFHHFLMPLFRPFTRDSFEMWTFSLPLLYLCTLRTIVVHISIKKPLNLKNQKKYCKHYWFKSSDSPTIFKP